MRQGEKASKAFLFALRAHNGQKRKDGQPYIVHPVEVALELGRSGADEALICAGYLHDTIEDAAVTREQLADVFGDEVADLVAAESEDKTKSWEQRKQDMLDALTGASRAQKMLLCADKLSNLRSVQIGLEQEGKQVWNRFKRGKEQQAWLYRSIVDALSELEGLAMYQELRARTEEIFG